LELVRARAPTARRAAAVAKAPRVCVPPVGGNPPGTPAGRRHALR
jgi:hypothetical protein